jgi:two-component system sensor histidine kinase UhpB
MWRNTPLRRRLNLVFAALIALWLVGDIARILAQAQPRIAAEMRAVTRLTQEFLISSLDRVQTAPDPQEAVLSLVSSLRYLRHVRVAVGEGALAASMAPAPDEDSAAPAWFRALVGAPVMSTTVPVMLGPRRLNFIVIQPDPSEIVAEVWSEAKGQLIAGAALAAAVVLVTNLLVRVALKPLAAAGETLARLEAGDYAARAKIEGSPEISAIAARINRLGQALGDLSADVRHLLERVVDAHDEERRAIARELHDETGPHLFALRANAVAIASRLADSESGAASLARDIAGAVESLQKQNRRILANLRPAALDELGLGDALQALVEQWRQLEPSIAIELAADPRLAELGPRASLTLYRFVQEALTNAFRHARARNIAIRIRYEAPSATAPPADPELAGLRARVEDDGQGVSEGQAPGMGLSGLRDRVRALGGEFAFGPGEPAGAFVEARFGLAG